MILDIHAHFYPQAYIDALETYGDNEQVGLLRNKHSDPVILFEGIQYFPLTPKFYDVDSRLKTMDDARVDMQAISIGPPMVYWMPPSQSLELCRIANNGIADIVKKYPHRFIGVGVVPLHDSKLAVEELKRTILDLGFKMVTIPTNVNSIQLDDSRFEEFYSAVEQLDVPIFVHPLTPTGIEKLVEYRLDIIVGFPFDTTISICRLIMGGVLKRFPRLKFCFAHVGGAIPFLASRLERGFQTFPVCRTKISGSTTPYLEKMYLDSAAFSDSPLFSGIGLVGTEKILFGTDSPFLGDTLADYIQRIENLSFLPSSAKKDILGGNSRRFLKLGS